MFDYGTFDQATFDDAGLPPSDPPPFTHRGRTVPQIAIVSQQPDWPYTFTGGRGPFFPRKLTPGIPGVSVNNPPFRHPGRAIPQMAVVSQQQPDPWVYSFQGGMGPFMPRKRLPLSVIVLQLVGRTALMVKAKAGFSGRAPLFGRASIKVKARSGGLFTAYLGGRTSSQVKARGVLSVLSSGALSGLGAIKFFLKGVLSFVPSRAKDRTIVPINVPRDITTQPYSRTVTAGNASRTVTPTPDLQAEQTYWTQDNSRTVIVNAQDRTVTGSPYNVGEDE